MILPNFVVFEGIDGTGTTSQLRLLKEHFTSEGKSGSCIFTQEPTAGEIGLLIRSALQGRFKLAPETMTRLFAADRCEHIYGAGGIVEAINDGKAVFSDRYLFFFDLPVAVSMSRVAGRSNLLEIYEEESFQYKVRDEYLQLLESLKKEVPAMHVIEINASKSIEEIHLNLWSILQNLPKI